MVNTPGVTAAAPYTLEQAESDIATLRGLVDTMNEAVTIYDGSVVPNVPSSSGATLYSSSGCLDYEGFDGNEYATGTLRQAIIGSQTISSTSPVTVSAGGVSLSAPVAALQYHFRFVIPFIGTASGSGGLSFFRVVCPAFTNGTYTANFSGNGLAGFTRVDNTSGGGVNLSGPIAVTTAAYLVEIEGCCNFTASGTLFAQALLSGAGTTQFVLYSNSFMELSPMV